MKNALALLFSSTFALTTGVNASAEVQLLRSAHELGDPSGYCLDIPTDAKRCADQHAYL